ncbi:unnamed protein product [Dicrocoelium dendriticum]|nr:unnamed protein product [Dicrocoelium dendriticum]
MQAKHMVLLSMAFVILGFVILIIGGIMLATATNYPTSEEAGTVLLRVSGRVACVFGGLLIGITMCTCLYMCIIGARYAATPDENENPTMGQMIKATKPAINKSILKTPGPQAGVRRWPMDEKWTTSNRLQKTVRLRHNSPSGDKPEQSQISQLNDIPWKNAHNSVDPQELFRRPHANQGFPYISRRHRRCQSLDQSTALVHYTPDPRPLFNTDNFSRTMHNRLWMPSLDDSSMSAFRTTDPISSDLLGRQVEPLGSMLHRGGRIKLGMSYLS